MLAAVLKLVVARSGTPPGKEDLPELAALARPFITKHYESLGLDSDTVAQLVRGLVNIVNGAAAIRNVSLPTHADVVEGRSEPPEPSLS